MGESGNSMGESGSSPGDGALMSLASGWNLSQRTVDAYSLLHENYEEAT